MATTLAGTARSHQIVAADHHRAARIAGTPHLTSGAHPAGPERAHPRG
ncbi:hypothetical protein [Nonomuraea sp. CA-141351]